MMWTPGGITPVSNYSSTTTIASLDWGAAAALSDLFLIRQPRPIPQDDLKNPYLLAWLLGDEPDIHSADPGPLIDQYKVLKAAAPNMPGFMNVSGGNVRCKKTPGVMDEQSVRAAGWGGE